MNAFGLTSIMNIFNSYVAVDLGTANTVISIRDKGIVLNEPSVVAYREVGGRRDAVAVGFEAKSMLGRTPNNIRTIRPLREGVIADFDAAEEMIRIFLQKAQRRHSFRRATVVVCVPSSATNVEQRIIRESMLRAGARRVFLLPEPMAAAIGAGLPVTEASGSMVIDIGGGTTEIAVISLGGIVHSSSIRSAGDRMDELIISYVRRNHGLLIGEATAEQIKIDIGCAVVGPAPDTRRAHLRGRDIATGGPREIELNQAQIAEALSDCLVHIVDSVQETLEQTPPELSADIIDKGVMITGGGAMLSGLDTLLHSEVGIMVSVADDPLTCVVRGTESTLEHIERYRMYFCDLP